MTRYEFWAHGVETVVEFPDRTAEVRHAGWGTLIRQAAGTDNWFHIAIPSAKIIDNSVTKMCEIRLRAEVNENAQIDLIHFRDDGKLIFSQAVNFMNQNVDEVFPSDDLPIEGGISLCIHVRFLSGSRLGYIIVKSAGGAFLT